MRARHVSSVCRPLVSLLTAALAALPALSTLSGCAGPDLGDDELSDPAGPGPGAVDDGELGGEGPGDGEEEGDEGIDGPVFTGDVPVRPEGDTLYGPSPTTGWRSQPFRFGIHSPTNVPQNARYTRQGNVHTMRVENGDAAFKVGSGTDPRTEMRWAEEYTSGQHMFDADFRVDSVAPNKGDGGTEKGTCIMQILRRLRPNGGPATALMLSARPDGTIRPWFAGNAPVLFRFKLGQWHNLKVAHNADTGQIRMFVDDNLVRTFQDRGQATHHFKNGVYGAKKAASARFERGTSVVQFRDITYWRR